MEKLKQTPRTLAELLREEFEDEGAVALALRRHQRTLKRMRDAGTGPAYILVGKRVLYRRSAVLDWLKGNEVQPARPCRTSRRRGAIECQEN